MRATRGTTLVLSLALWVAALLGAGVCPTTAFGQEELFVPDSGNNSITVYSRTASGNTVPIRTLAGAAAWGEQLPLAGRARPGLRSSRRHRHGLR